MFASPHSLNFGVPSRRDDLYQLVYMMLFMLNAYQFPGNLEDELDKARGSMEKRVMVSHRFKQSHCLTRLANLSQQSSDVINNFCEYV
jgi:hypothetical protein